MHPVAAAVHANDIDALRHLITSDNINVQMSAWTPLARTAYYGRNDMMEFLIGRGADLNAVDKDGYTPLVAAVVKDNLVGTQILLRAGASTMLRPIQQTVIIECITRVRSCHDTVRLIIRHGTRFVTDVPAWICEHQAQIERDRTSVVTLLGVWRLKRPLVTAGQDMRLMTEVAKLIWNMR
jgi:ankyrin repeat protein